MNKLVALLTALLLVGCVTTTNTHIDPRRGLAPQSPILLRQTESVGAKKDSPVLIRIFKQEHELELWRQDDTGHYALVQVIPICMFSGELGPKRKQGDRQAPEGFYNITLGQLNYNSIRWVSMDTGYPNAYDRYHGGTGSAVMIHGGCDSAGCYAIEDGPAQDLFAAVRDALKAGQRSVQLHIFPFKMTSLSMVAADKKHKEFWRQLKLGFDAFEGTHRDIDVTVVNGKYFVK